MKIEEKYRKLDDIEHVLLRAGMYVGSTVPHDKTVFLIDQNEKFESREVSYNPAFLKIFDEIISNAVDEHRRNPQLNQIVVSIDKDTQRITVRDNGGIPVVIHGEYNQWVPEMIFSNLKAGSNFNDDEERLVAGTNGVGSTLTNIFSREFQVITCDGKNRFNQTFFNNMRDRNPPKVTKSKESGFTEIRFVPDLSRFKGMEQIEETHVLMMKKRCIDLAACNPSLTVIFNQETFRFPSFEDYCSLYSDVIAFDKQDRWQVGFSVSEGSFTQVSFVNSVETSDGGTHVDTVVSSVIEWLREKIRKKHKIDLRPAEIRNHISVFVQSDIVNPAFSSQTKEKLITESKDFGSRFEPSAILLKKLFESEIVQRILDWADQKRRADERKQLRALNKGAAKSKVLKLIDAKSRTNRESCSICLFEGDCLEDNTEVFVFRPDDGPTKVRIADVQVGDHVITHANGLKEVTAKSSKISKIFNVKTSLGILKASGAHRMWAYDAEVGEFAFVRVDCLVPGRHRLVKNKLSTASLFIKIHETTLYKGNVVISCDDDIIVATPTHKFAIFDVEDQHFKMVESKNLDPKSHYLVLNTVV